MLAEAQGRLALKEARGEPAGRGLSLLVFHIGLSGSASDSRSQIQNHAAALFRLRLRFALELRSPLTELPKASALWRGRCDKAGRLKVNDEPASQLVSQSVTTTTLLGRKHPGWPYYTLTKGLYTDLSRDQAGVNKVRKGSCLLFSTREA